MGNLIQYRGPFQTGTTITSSALCRFSLSINEKDNMNRANLEQHRNNVEGNNIAGLSDFCTFKFWDSNSTEGQATTIYIGKTGMYENDQFSEGLRLKFPNGAPQSLIVNISQK